MVEVRTQDKVFVALLVPAALIAALVYFWRMPLVKTRDALRAECARLPDEQMFPLEKRQLASRLEEAKRELEHVKAEKPPATQVKGDPTASVAERQAQALAIFTGEGARIVRTEPAQAGMGSEEANQSASRGGATLQVTGIRPTPEAVRVVVEATYPQMTAAFRRMAKEQLAIVPENVSLKAGKNSSRWEMTLWL